MATVAFDLNGTLLDPSALAEPLGGDEPSCQLVLRALDTAVVQGMAFTLSGGYRPFPQLIEAGLRRELELCGRDADLASAAVERLGAMAPFPEAAEALDVLARAGHRLAVVTNSATADAEEVLANAGLRDRFAAVIGTDDACAFKPDGRVYASALDRLGSDGAETWLVAAHWWDVLGASRAGLRTAWVARKERVLLASVVPDVSGDDLLAAAQAVIAAAR